MKRVIRTQSYLDDLNQIEAYIRAKGMPQAATDLWLHIDDQVEKLSDPNHPRRKGHIVTNAMELVAHENYVVIFDEDAITITVWNVIHVKKKNP